MEGVARWRRQQSAIRSTTRRQIQGTTKQKKELAMSSSKIYGVRSGGAGPPQRTSGRSENYQRVEACGARTSSVVDSEDWGLTGKRKPYNPVNLCMKEALMGF